jgi:hypothetical protein
VKVKHISGVLCTGGGALFFLIFQISPKNIRRLRGAELSSDHQGMSVRFYVVSFRDYHGAIAGASRDHFVVSSIFLECTDRTTATSGARSK